MCYSGFTRCDVRRAVFPLVDDWPLMLGIMAGMDQKDIFLRMRLTRRRLRQAPVRGWLCWFSSRCVPSCVEAQMLGITASMDQNDSYVV